MLRGAAGADRFEPGAGDDRVTGGAGDDIAFKWWPGDLAYDGGAGRDTLSFAADRASDPFPTPAVTTLALNLGTGTGRSPWGGTIRLKSVEVIRDTDGRDVIDARDFLF